MAKGLTVRGWRIGQVEPDGLSCYFDPFTERVEIHQLTEAEKAVMVDRVSSVRGVVEVEAPRESSEQLDWTFDLVREIHNGTSGP